MKFLLLLILLVVPQLAAARVYMCVDPNTGKTSFSDKGCPTVALQEEVRVDPTNLSSGARTRSGGASGKTWSSDRDTRKNGLEYTEQRQRERQRNATASVSGANRFDGS